MATMKSDAATSILAKFGKLGHLLPEPKALLSVYMEHLEWILLGLFVFLLGSVGILLFFSRSRKPKANKGADSGVGIHALRDEAQHLVKYLDNLADQTQGIAKAEAAPAAASGDGGDWKKKAETAQQETLQLKAQVAQLAQELQQLKAQAAGAAQLPQVKAQLTQLQAENAALKAQAAQGASGGSGDPKIINQLNEKIKFLEQKLQEYAIIEEDIAEARALRQENQQLRDQIKTLGGQVPIAVAPPMPAAPTSVAPIPAQAVPPAAATPPAAAVPQASGTPPATTSTDPFSEFDEILKEFDGGAAPQPAAPPQPAAAATPAAAPANPTAAPQEVKPDEQLEQEFQRFVE
jgi:uncharacterized phage infection (PIP) family protein YhgE